MPKRMLWVEKLFQSIPIGKESVSFASFLKVRLVRALCVTFIFVLVGVPFILGSRFRTNDSNFFSLVPTLYLLLYVFLVFVVSGWFQNKWSWFFNWSSHILKLGETEFNKFRDRMERLINSFYACLAIAVIFVIIGMIPSMRIVMEQMAPMVSNPILILAYLVFINSFFMLLLGTMIWIIVSMWIVFYITLRHPLNLKLSPRVDEEFRPLAIWSLKALIITFVLVAFFAVFYSSGILISPSGVAGFLGLMTSILILGAVAFVFPFYHVHRVLTKLKKQELHEIEEEHDRIIQDLTSLQVSDTEARIRGLVSLEILHIRERRAKDADVWPIDTTILSAMAGLVLIPIVVNIVTNLM